MFEPTQRFDAVVAEIDAANASDPRTIVVGGGARPYEIVYAERMGERLTSIYPEASELLRIAAHAQHIRRWDIPRSGYPEGRRGYNDWRKARREHHAKLATGIMTSHGYREDEIQHVVLLIKKEQLKKDKESQALENVVAVVFLEHYFDEFHSKHNHYIDSKRRVKKITHIDKKGLANDNAATKPEATAERRAPRASVHPKCVMHYASNFRAVTIQNS